MRQGRPAAKATVDRKNGQISGIRGAALAGGGRRESRTGVRFRNPRRQMDGDHRRRHRQRRQGRAQIMRRKAKQAGVRRQRLVVTRRMLDGVRPRQQLGEDENSNEKQMAQRIHDGSLVDLDE